MITAPAWLITVWRTIAGSRIVQGAIFVAGAIAYHAFAKWSAKREGRQEERREAREAAYEKRSEHEGDIHAARQKLDTEQQERRKRDEGNDPRARFGKQPRD